jgi:hypothetical protein
LGHSPAEIQLVDLAVLVPHGGLVVHHELASLGDGVGVAVAPVRLDLAPLQLKQNKTQHLQSHRINSRYFLSELRLLEGLQVSVVRPVEDLVAGGGHLVVGTLLVAVLLVLPSQERRREEILPNGGRRLRSLP